MIGFPHVAGAAARSMGAVHDEGVAAGASGSRPHHISRSMEPWRLVIGGSGGGLEHNRLQGLVAEGA